MTHNGNSNGAAPHRAAAETSKRERRARRRRFKRPALVEHAEQESLDALRAELLVLREENIRLKSSQLERPDLGRLLERTRALPKTRDVEAGADEAAHMLAEGLVIRESLKEICAEMQRAMAAVAASLDALSPTPPAAGEWIERGNRRLAALPVEACDTNGHGSGAS